jgi:hypothetical protein
MVKFTKQHFTAVAELISKVPKAQRKAEAERYCKLFKESNQLFNREKFLKACNV